MKTYDILLKSSTGTQNTDTTSIDYKFDWGIIPEGDYELSFTFQSAAVATVEKNDAHLREYPVLVEAIVPFSSDRYMTKTGGMAMSSQVIGLIKSEFVESAPSSTGLGYALVRYVSQLDNQPIHLYGKPQGNDLRINLKNYGGALADATLPLEYVMSIHLKSC